MTTEYQVSPRRWLIIGLFVSQGILSMVERGMFGPINGLVARLYEEDYVTYNFISSVYNITYVPSALLYLFLSEGYGLYSAGCVAVIFNFLGALVKVLSHYAPISSKFQVVMAGQTLLSMGSPFWTTFSPRIAVEWLPEKDVGRGTMLLTFASMSIGTMVGSLMSLSMPKNVAPEKSLAQLDRLLLGPAVVLLVSSTLFILFFKSEPEHPPSFAAAEIRRLKLERKAMLPPGSSLAVASLKKLWTDFKFIAMNKHFYVLLIGVLVNLALFLALQAIQAEILEPCGTAGVLSYISTIGVGVSAVSVAVVGKLSARFGVLKVVRVLATMGGASIIFFLASVKPEATGLVIASLLSMSASLSTMFPMLLNIARVLVYPITSDVASFAMLAFSEVTNTGSTVLASKLMSDPRIDNCEGILSTKLGIYLLTLTVLSTIILCLVRVPRSSKAMLDINRKKKKKKGAADAAEDDADAGPEEERRGLVQDPNSEEYMHSPLLVAAEEGTEAPTQQISLGLSSSSLSINSLDDGKAKRKKSVWEQEVQEYFADDDDFIEDFGGDYDENNHLLPAHQRTRSFLDVLSSETHRLSIGFRGLRHRRESDDDNSRQLELSSTSNMSAREKGRDIA